MKTTFEIHPFIDRMLNDAGYDAERILRAVDSTLTQAELEANKAKSERTDVKVKESKGEGNKKPATFSFSEKETITDTYKGKANGPSRFAAWHDAQSKVWKQCGEPSDEINAGLMPVHVCVWLGAFRKTPAGPTAEESLAQAHRNAGNLLAAVAAETPAKLPETRQNAGNGNGQSKPTEAVAK